MTRTASATTTILPLRPPTVLVATLLSPSLTPQLKPSANLKTTLSPAPGLQGSAPLTVPVIATLEPQGQSKLTKLASPAHATFLSGAPAQLNTPPPEATAQQ